eukprot:Lankesteria_metandrocarpae@DN2539_c1_g1_i1.p1
MRSSWYDRMDDKPLSNGIGGRLLYLAVRGLSRIVVNGFFKEITLVGLENVPVIGPVIFVGNHNNQFVDASILMALMPRRVRFLIAHASMTRPVIGNCAKAAGCIAVKRPQDLAFDAMGSLTCCAESAVVTGTKTRMTLDLRPGDKLKINGCLGTYSVKEVQSDCRLLLTAPIPKAAFPYKALSDTDDGDSGDAVQHSSTTVTTMTTAATDSSTLRNRMNNDNSSSTSSTSTVGTDGSGTTTATDDKEEQSNQQQSKDSRAADTQEERLGDVVDGGEVCKSQRMSVWTASWKVLPHVDQSEVFEAVTEALKAGSTIGVFPEGGSHDRTDLLPLKPGVAVMALSSAFNGAQDVLIVPIGCTYFEGHKVMGSALVQIGRPLEVSAELVQKYKVDRREAVSDLLMQVEESLRKCLTTATDHRSLKTIRLCATLYPPERMMVSNDAYHNLCRLFSPVLADDDDEELVSLRRELLDYSHMIKSYGIKDYEVWQLKQSFESAFVSLMDKLALLALSAVFACCMIAVWLPLKLVSSYYAERRRAKAVMKSSVKILGKDVIASDTITLILIVLPVLSIICGIVTAAVVTPRPLLSLTFTIPGSLLVVPYLTYWSHGCFSRIMPLAQQIRLLFIALSGNVGMWYEVEKELITKRGELQVKVRETITKVGSRKEPGFMALLEGIFPKAVVDADTRRLKRSKENFLPILARTYFECREEII